MSNNLESNLSNISIFKDLIENYFFKIPNYQRPYSWEEENLMRFLLDLKEYNQEYYLGHFLFENKKEDRFNIIDGQQRLTTIILFLRALYEINNDLINKDVYFGNKEKLKVIDNDSDIFRKLINENGINHISQDNLTSISQKRMLKAKEFFINELQKEEHQNDLFSYLKTIETSRISCSNFGSKIIANQVFMFHNNRGKPLTNLDKLKSFLINLLNKNYKNTTYPDTTLSENISIIIEKPFEKIISSIAKIDNLTFNPNENQILNSHFQVYFRKNFNYDDFEKEYNNDNYNMNPTNENFINTIKNFTKNLQNSYEHILEIVQQAEKNNMLANVLSLRAGYQEYSLLLALSLHNKNWNTDFNKQVLKLMEIILFRNNFASVSRTQTNYFDWLANQFFIDGTFDKWFYAGKNKKELSLLSYLEYYATIGFKNYWEIGAHFVNYFNYQENKTNDFFNGKKEVTKYILWKYENYLREKDLKDKKVTAIPNLILANEFKNGKNFTSIEHIYPQNPDETKAENLGVIVHDIGNLIAMNLSLNIGLSNKESNKKYGDMLPSNFKHHNNIINDIQNGNWNKETIIENGKRIKDFALQYFSIYKPELIDNKVQFIENEKKQLDIIVDKSEFNTTSY